VTQCGSVTTSVEGEAAPERENGGDNVSWFDTNLNGKKMKKIHPVDSTGTNGQCRFKAMMS
jgi:hypothetical protein